MNRAEAEKLLDEYRLACEVMGNGVGFSSAAKEALIKMRNDAREACIAAMTRGEASGWRPLQRMSRQDIHRARELISAASTSVEWGVVNNSIEEHASDFRQSLSWPTAVGTELHGVYLAGTETVVCHTGNGPTSEANAILITFAMNNLGKLLDEIESLCGIAPLPEPPDESKPADLLAHLRSVEGLGCGADDADFESREIPAAEVDQQAGRVE